jgi:hypothetical protein
VELVGVVAGVAEHAAGPPRRGRRLQRGGGGVAGEAGLEVSVSLRGDGVVVVRHFSLALCLFPRRIGALLSLLLLWKEGSGVRGRRERGRFIFWREMEGGRCNFSFWSSVYLWGLNIKVAPSTSLCFAFALGGSTFFFDKWIFQHNFEGFCYNLQVNWRIYCCRVIRKPWCVFNFLHSHSCHSSSTDSCG